MSSAAPTPAKQRRPARPVTRERTPSARPVLGRVVTVGGLPLHIRTH